MRSVKLSLFFLSFLISGIFAAPSVSLAEEKSWSDRMKSDLGAIKDRLAALEKQQQEIIAKEDDILKELDRIRIWVHKR